MCSKAGQVGILDSANLLPTYQRHNRDRSSNWWHVGVSHFHYHSCRHRSCFSTTSELKADHSHIRYYLLYSEGPQQQIQAFPNGFQMVAGDTNRRNFTCAIPEPPKSLWTGFEITQPALQQKALGFNCLNYNDPSKTEPSLMRHYLPDKSFMDENCLDGIRTELMFPSCWNGKDMDTPDHKSHMVSKFSSRRRPRLTLCAGIS